jgi:5-oxoprolinase (ATP-hydrolysing) subunit A
MPRIDLNCDLGEGAGHDEELMPLVTSANIACGAHAGDTTTMRNTVMLALQHGVAIGAHPGFADRENFGRRELAVSPSEIHTLVVEQTRALQEIAHRCGAAVTHVKAHGALYNLVARDPANARAVAEAVQVCGRELVLFALAGSVAAQAAEELGLRVAHEVFADRTYQPDGSLTPRSRPDALIADEVDAVRQAMSLVTDGRVRAPDGTEISVRADTLCLHGDGIHAVEFARLIRRAFFAAGIEVRPVGNDTHG